MEDSITVIILGFNDLKWLSKCIDSVLNSSYSNLRVMYVDNASTDGSVDFVRNSFPNVEVVSSAVNLGYAAVFLCSRLLDVLCFVVICCGFVNAGFAS